MIHGPSISVRETPGASAPAPSRTLPAPLLSANICVHSDSFFFSGSCIATETSSWRKEEEGIPVSAGNPGGK